MESLLSFLVCFKDSVFALQGTETAETEYLKSLADQVILSSYQVSNGPCITFVFIEDILRVHQIDVFTLFSKQSK